MAKKRKLRSSDIEPTKQPDSDVIQEQQQTLEGAQDHMSIDQQQQQQPIEEYNQIEEQQQLEEDVEEGNDDDEAAPENETLEDQNQEQDAEPSNDDAATPSESVKVEVNGEGNNEEEEDLELEEEPVEKLLEPFTKEQLHALVKQAVEKFPDFAENVRQLADVDPAHRKIFIHGLGWDATAETLTSLFSKYGEIEDCKAVTDKLSGKSKGYAFILFKHRSGARKALKQPQKKIGNRITSCQLASAGPVPAPPPVAPAVSEYTQRKIFVSNVSADIDPQKLLEFFRQFGEVEDGPLGLDKQTGKPRGFALFVYKSVDSAKKALEDPHKQYEGHVLYCQKAVDGPKGKQGYHQQPHHQHHQHQHHSHHHHQPHFQRKDKNKYSSSGGPAHGGGHLMAPSGPSVGGYNPGVPAAQGLNPVLGQAISALLTTQGAGLGLGNLLGGLGGAHMNHSVPPAGYGNQPTMNYGNQPGMQQGYQNPQMGQNSGVRPHPGAGAPYMGH
ncbi:hypothetical protein TanjilG_00725 [Lupinus angustifolius]|uniref:RRM domain-containing protein n=1 Tax=Lupinus angustifolius TaxID=3871 RepID=A0A4P1R8C2_LUPAN|nr:PREDICTED: UBP1-associated protein 2A-like [Lupinus angustifolius]OIW04165.1 hypothetical protein TanjilG_00725 [Lupinus angustifolius]